MKIPIMWRKFFKNIAENTDYIYNYFTNNPYKKFNRYCNERCNYNLLENNTVTKNDDNILINNNNHNVLYTL